MQAFESSKLSPFVGRIPELQGLSDSWQKAVNGDRQVVFVSGEPGIGKTRLVSQLADLVRAEGGRVLLGRCDEEALIVYEPFVEALRSHLEIAPEDFSSQGVGPFVSELARLLPELASRRRLLEPDFHGDPEAERYRLFEAVVAFFVTISHIRPALLILDDLHWADRASLLLLKHILRSPRKANLLLVATYRDTDLRRGHPLTDLLADLRRDRLFQRTALNGLTQQELSSLVKAWVGPAASEGFVTALHLETEGNPFFAEEVLEHFLETREVTDQASWTEDTLSGDFSIPDGLREVIGRRLSRLTESTNQLLTAAAVLGKDFDAGVVQHLASLDDDTLLNALDEALRSRLIVEQGRTPHPRYSFSHSLVRQTLYEELNLPRRQRLHLRAAQAIEALYGQNHGDGGIAALATHYRNAGALADPEKAISYSERAAEAATRVFAWEEAVAHYEGVLEVLDLGSTEHARRCDCLLALGWILMPPGEPQRVLESIAPEALAIAENIGDPDRAASACRLAMEAFSRAGARLITLTAQWHRWAEAYERYAGSDTIDRIRLDVDYGESFHMSGEEALAWTHRSEALKLAERLNAADERILATAYTLYYTQSPMLEAQRLEVAIRASAWPIAGASARTVATFYLYLGWAFLDWGEWQKATEVFERLKRLPATFRDPFVMEYAVFADAAGAALEGRLEDAVALAKQMVPLSDEIGSGVFGRLSASNIAYRALLHLGRPEEAIEMLSWGWQAAGLDEEPAVNTPRRALALAFSGKQAEAASLLARVMEQRAIGEEDDSNVATTDLMILLETATVLRESERASILYQRLRHVSALVKVHGGTQTSVGRLLGDAALLLDQPSQAKAHYETAIEVCEKIGFRPEIAVLHLALAELLAGHFPSERDAATKHLVHAMDAFSEMGMRPWLERAAHSRGLRRSGASYPDGLSEREVEVLRLLAQGKSNQQIAAELSISPHTAGHHVGSILGKVGVANRTEAASYAFQHGLAASAE